MMHGLREAGDLFVLFLTVLLVGCATFGTPSGPGDDPGGRLTRGSVALEQGRFGQAYRDFRALARRCESGTEGREAVLLLATLELDPRNPARLAPAGAQLAARYLQTPSLSVTSLRVAESLYLLALDLGAAPVEDPFAPIPIIPGLTAADTTREATADTAEDRDADRGDAVQEPWSVAPRFRDCGSAASPQPLRELPLLSGPSLDATLESLVDQREALRARVDSLSAELERVRGLLRSDPPRPDAARDQP